MSEIRRCALPSCPNPIERSNQAYCSLADKQLGYRQRRLSETITPTEPAASIVSGTAVLEGAVPVPPGVARPYSPAQRTDYGEEIAMQAEAPHASDAFAGYVEPDRPRPTPVGPVAYRGRMVLKEGTRHRVCRPENWQWRAWRT